MSSPTGASPMEGDQLSTVDELNSGASGESNAHHYNHHHLHNHHHHHHQHQQNNRRANRCRPKTMFRLVVMGSSRVGKTAIINQFLYDTFVTNHKPTVEELHRGEYEVAGATVVLDVLDTSGTYSFPAMRALSIERADGFVLVYAVDDVKSFDEVRSLRDQIIEGRSPSRQKVDAAIVRTTPDDESSSSSSSSSDSSTDVASSSSHGLPPIVVVANKDDLRGETERDVAAETTVCIDWEHGFVEASAKLNYNVDRIFQELLSRVDHCQFDGNSDLQRRYSCPPNFQRGFIAGDTGTATATAATGNSMKQLLKRHSCNIS